MKHTLQHRFHASLICILALLLLLSAFIPAASAETNGSEQTAVIELAGREANGRYELNAENLSLFSLESIAPGDNWRSSVKVMNTTNADMAVSVYSITNTLEHDTALFDVLDLRITVAGEEGYRGSYSANGPMVTNYYQIPAGKDLIFDIEVTFPGTAGNEYQGKQMDSIWTFDAVYYEPENDVSGTPDASNPHGSQNHGEDGVKTGMDLSDSNTTLITSLFVFLFALIAAGITYGRYRSAKKAQEQWLNKKSSVDEDLQK